MITAESRLAIAEHQLAQIRGEFRKSIPNYVRDAKSAIRARILCDFAELSRMARSGEPLSLDVWELLEHKLREELDIQEVV